MYQEITHCRICGNSHLIPLLSLGNLALTGIFPKTKNEIIPTSILRVTFFAGVQLLLLSLGIIGEYIGRIYDEVKCPQGLIVDKRVNL